jgi:ribonucleoside-triphosphate reductase
MERYVENYFTLNDESAEYLNTLTPNFGFDGFGEVIFYRTYSRYNDVLKKQETWNDVVRRVTNGIFSIRKDFYLKNHIEWKEQAWQKYAKEFGTYLFNMYFVPPGRGLWAMGTPFIYERGSMALYNCAFTNLTGDNLADDIEWLMDSLMLGVGVGFEALRDNLNVYTPQGRFVHIIPDTREGWAHSVRLLIEAYTCPNRKLPHFDYTTIRREGLLIKGFGGLSSGPAPLERLHKQIIEFFEAYLRGGVDVVQLKTDIANCVGVCVVAGNVRRSAEIALGSIRDQVFMDLKDYDKYPGRQAYGWMSNNTVKCEIDEDFGFLGDIAKRVVVRGEPGFANTQNFPVGRVGKRKRYPSGRKDMATGLNPCGEITLEHREVCNLAETCPTRCPDIDVWYRACSFASFYCSTVSLLPTHQSSTNHVVARNRRIGVGIIDGAAWIQKEGLHNIIRYLRNGYKIVRTTNRAVNAEAGVPEAIKVTTIKPGGTTPKLIGGIGGIGHGTFNYTLRRVRVAHNAPIVRVLNDAKVPFEKDIFDPNTLIYEFPTYQHGKPAQQVSLWEQAFNLITFQREWSDNAVSNTLYFSPKWRLKKVYADYYGDSVKLKMWRQNAKGWLGIPIHPDKDDDHTAERRYKVERNEKGEVTKLNLYEYNPQHEEDIIGTVMAHIAPHTKSCSFLPHSDVGVYPQMPEEGLTEREYTLRLNRLKKFDWASFTGSNGIDEKYCTGDTCELPKR